MPSKAERNLFILKPRDQIISTYISDCSVMLGLDVPFTSHEIVSGSVAPHVLIDHFFKVYQIIAERMGLTLFHF